MIFLLDKKKLSHFLKVSFTLDWAKYLIVIITLIGKTVRFPK